MLRKLACFAVSFWSLSTYSQANLADSLKNLLDRHTTRDTIRVGYILKYSSAILYSTPDSILRYQDEALEIAESLKWQWGISRVYNLKAIYFSQIKNDQVKALDYYQKAFKENKEPFSPVLGWQIQYNIGIIYYNQKQYKKALDYFTKSLSIVNTLDDKKDKEQLLLSIGNGYYDTQQPDSAIKYFTESLNIAEKNNNLRIVAAAINSLSIFYMEAKKYKEAEPLTHKSIALSFTTNDLAVRANSYVNLAQIKLYWNETDSAEYYAKKGLELADSSQNMQFRRQSWEALSMIYERKKDFEKAYHASKNFSVLNDSMLSDQVKQEVLQKDLQFEQEKKEAILNAQYQSELKRQQTIRNFLLTGTAIIIISALLLFFSYKRRRDAYQRQKEAEFNAEVTDTEMKALRAQMNPHFIFNSLNSISDYISKNNLPEAGKYLGKFAKLMRMILENSEQKEVAIKDDLKALELYMDLEAMRMKNKFIYEIKVDAGIDQEQTLIPPLILQPFVENSILHGFTGKEETGKILIQVEKQGNMISCIVEDNGVGRMLSTSLKATCISGERKSVGMKITGARIDILNKVKNTKAGIELFDIAQGMRVEVKLPLNLQF